jgi:hypothetical protein
MYRSFPILVATIVDNILGPNSALDVHNGIGLDILDLHRNQRTEIVLVVGVGKVVPREPPARKVPKPVDSFLVEGVFPLAAKI